MPFLLLVGAAPNAIAYNSKQFTTGEFFLWGVPASVLLMLVTWLAVPDLYVASAFILTGVAYLWAIQSAWRKQQFLGRELSAPSTVHF